MVNTPRRQRLSLDGKWGFHVEGEPEARGDIAVPLPWEATYPDLRDRPCTATYTRSFSVPASWRGSLIRLNVGAADYYSEVSINGYLVGTHEGGYLPFSFEVQEFLRPGEDNTIQIKVSDGAPARIISGAGDLTPERTALTRARPFPFTEIPHGKQSWYGTIGGIWQSVSLERCPDVFIDNVFIRPDVAREGASVRVRLEHPPLDAAGYTLRLVVKEPRGASAVLPVELPLPGARQATLNLALSIPDPALWDMDNPHLYGLTVELRLNGKVIDAYETRFGMRTIEAKDGNILLNGHPIFVAGVLDQDFYPITLYTPPSTAYLRDQFKKAKELGLNLMRCHIKTPDPRYLDLCDEMGLMVWYEIPSWAVLSKNSGKRGREHFEQMLERDYNHASLLILTIMNESWGIDLSEKWQRDWLVDMYEYAKALDPSRLICDNSACEGNFHVKSDIDDYHIYFSVPDHADKWRDWLADFASRPAWTYTRHGDAQRTKKEPVLLSEFGNWGLPKISQLKKGHNGEEPWWFKTGAGAARPEGAEERFQRFHLDRIFGSYDRLAEASQEQEFLSLKFEIEEMRKHTSIVGYVITEFTDLNWESNGLLDMCRNPKVFHKRMAPIQAQDLVFVDHERVSYTTGERFEMSVLLSRFGRNDLAGATLKWEVDGVSGLSGELQRPDTPAPIGASTIGTISFVVPEVKKSQGVTLRLHLRDKDGKSISVNSEKLYFFPASVRRVDLKQPVFLYDPGRAIPNARTILSRAGLRLASRLEPGVLLIASTLDQTALRFVADGGTALLIANERTALPRTHGGPASVSRDVNGWWGDWCSNLTWFQQDGARPGGPFASMPQIKQFDFLYRHVAPRRVLTGWDVETEFDDIHTGLILGWVHNPATLVGGFAHGRGKVLATTLELFKHETDPVGVTLLGDLLRYIASPRFAPVKRFGMEWIDLQATLIASAESLRPATWRYQTTQPADDWTRLDFNDSGWKSGKAGFGQGIGQVTTRTRWATPGIWLRNVVDVPAEGIARVALHLFHDDDVEIWVNGEPLLTRSGFVTEYQDIILAPDQAALLRPGRNVVCVHCRNLKGPQYVDLGITYEPAAATAAALPTAGLPASNGHGESHGVVVAPGESTGKATTDTATSGTEVTQEREGILQTTR